MKITIPKLKQLIKEETEKIKYLGGEKEGGADLKYVDGDLRDPKQRPEDGSYKLPMDMKLFVPLSKVIKDLNFKNKFIQSAFKKALVNMGRRDLLRHGNPEMIINAVLSGARRGENADVESFLDFIDDVYRAVREVTNDGMIYFESSEFARSNNPSSEIMAAEAVIIALYNVASTSEVLKPVLTGQLAAVDFLGDMDPKDAGFYPAGENYKFYSSIKAAVDQGDARQTVDPDYSEEDYRADYQRAMQESPFNEILSIMNEEDNRTVAQHSPLRLDNMFHDSLKPREERAIRNIYASIVTYARRVANPNTEDRSLELKYYKRDLDLMQGLLDKHTEFAQSEDGMFLDSIVRKARNEILEMEQPK